MRIAVFSDDDAVRSAFSEVMNASSDSILIRPAGEYKSFLKKCPRDTFVYIDVSTLSDAGRNQLTSLFKKYYDICYGILDPGGVIEDVAELFHAGCSDYMGSEILKKRISAKRIKRCADFCAPRLNTTATDSDRVRRSCYLLSGNNWDAVKSGHEYTFCFMFIELDHQREFKKAFGEAYQKKVVNSFRSFVESAVTPDGGRIWIWMEFGGLILFPFDGKRCPAILTAFRLMLARKTTIRAEYPQLSLLPTYRIALHLGNTVYKSRGETGTIVSDSINSIFHLGQRYTEPGNLYLTKEVLEFAPSGLEKMFLPAGTYEDREILRMRLPV